MCTIKAGGKVEQKGQLPRARDFGGPAPCMGFILIKGHVTLKRIWRTIKVFWSPAKKFTSSPAKSSISTGSIYGMLYINTVLIEVYLCQLTTVLCALSVKNSHIKSNTYFVERIILNIVIPSKNVRICSFKRQKYSIYFVLNYSIQPSCVFNGIKTGMAHCETKIINFIK